MSNKNQVFKSSLVLVLLFSYINGKYVIGDNDLFAYKEHKLYATDGTTNDNFGNSLDIFGDLCVVGAFSSDVNGILTGAAFIYRINHTSWIQEAKLVADDSQDRDFFGWSVAASSDEVIIGAYMAPGDPVTFGSAYVFISILGIWTKESTLKAYNFQGDGIVQDYQPDYDYFGWSVDIYNDTALVGAYGDDERGSFSGSVYVFNRYNYLTTSFWSQTKKLYSVDAAAFDSFGWSVSLYSSTAIIGAYAEADSFGDTVGSAFIFENDAINGWSQIAKLQPVDKARNDFFGWSVGIWDNVAVVGAHWSSVDTRAVGAAYVFQRYSDGTWSHQTKLSASDSSSSSSASSASASSASTLYFGYSVAIHSKIIAVSSFSNSFSTSRTSRNNDGDASEYYGGGIVYIYNGYSDMSSSSSSSSGEFNTERNDHIHWKQSIRIIPNDSAADSYDDFGVSVAIWEDVVAVGAKRADGASSYSGVAYVYYKSEYPYARPIYFPVRESTFVALVAFLPLTFIVTFLISFIAFYIMRRRNKNSGSSNNTDSDEIKRIAVVTDEDFGMEFSTHSVSSLISLDSMPG